MNFTVKNTQKHCQNYIDDQNNRKEAYYTRVQAEILLKKEFRCVYTVSE